MTNTVPDVSLADGVAAAANAPLRAHTTPEPDMPPPPEQEPVLPPLPDEVPDPDPVPIKEPPAPQVPIKAT